jgi:hypothetical protein
MYRAGKQEVSKVRAGKQEMSMHVEQENRK